MKYFYIFLNTLLCVSYSYGQILPHGLIHKKDFSATSIYADAQMRFGYSTSNPRIKSDFYFAFSNNTPYTIQFEFGIYDDASQYTNSYKIPLIGFTNDDLTDDKAIVLYSFVQNRFLTSRTNSVNCFLKNQILNSNTDLDKSKTEYGIPYNGFQTYLITTTYDGTKWKTYRNGILIDETINTSSWSGTGYLTIGNDNALDSKFSHLYLYFDEVRFWDRALSTSEIANNWNRPLSGAEQGLKVYYNFNNQGYPNANNLHVKYLKDQSMNNKNAVFVNTALDGNFNNFVPTTDNYFKRNGIFENPIFHFDANNIDCYPGSNFHNNPHTFGKLYNLIGFNNNLEFYTNTNYNQLIDPVFNLDGGRSFLINNIYGRSALNSGITGTDPVTVETWVKFTSLVNQSIFLIGENSQYKQFEIKLRNGILSIGVGNQDFTIGPRNLTINKWYHIVYTFEKINYKIYFNGILDSETTFGNLVNKVVNGNTIEVSDAQNTSNTPIYIGVENSPFRGKISVLNVYNKAINSNEIANKFNTIKARFGY